MFPAILVVRPPATGTFQLLGLQFDFPGAPPGGGAYVPLQLPEGVLLWTTNNPFTLAPAGTPTTMDRTLRFPLFSGSGLPNVTPFTMTVQLFGLVSTAIPGGNLGPVCANPVGSTTVASAAVWISY